MPQYMVEDEAVYYIKDLNFEQKKKFSQKIKRKKTTAAMRNWRSGEVSTNQGKKWQPGGRTNYVYTAMLKHLA